MGRSEYANEMARRATFRVSEIKKGLGGRQPPGSNPSTPTKKEPHCVRLSAWALTDSNRRPSACKADALNQLS